MTADRLIAFPKRLSDLSEEDVWNFYHNIYLEREIAGFTPVEETRLFRYDCGFGNMEGRLAYYRQAFVRPFHRALAAVFKEFETPRLLDVCCGTGMQAIAFALLGAQVTALDYDQEQLDTLEKRAKVYERIAGHGLGITTGTADVKTYDFARLGGFDVVYSHGGAGQFMTAQDLFARIGQVVKPGGLLILKNGNPDCLWLRAAKIAPLDSPLGEYYKQAKAHGFTVDLARGTTAFPRPLWVKDIPLNLLDPLLRGVNGLQVHFEYIFRKTP